MSTKILFGFHAVTVRLKIAPASISEIHVDSTRRDARMRQFVQRAQEAGKDDGFSNPQLSEGAEVAPVLDRLAQQLGGS